MSALRGREPMARQAAALCDGPKERAGSTAPTAVRHRRTLLPTLQGVSGHLRRFRREAADARSLAAELLALPPAARLPRLDEVPAAATLALADHLAERPDPLAEIDPERASLAVAAARRLDPYRYSPTLIADARARALLAVAEAAALAGEPERATLALAGAERAAELGTGDAQLAGALAEGRALSMWAAGKADAALAALDEAEHAYRETGDTVRLATLPLRRGFLLVALGRTELARAAFESVLAALPHDHPVLVTAARWALDRLDREAEDAAP